MAAAAAVDGGKPRWADFEEDDDDFIQERLRQVRPQIVAFRLEQEKQRREQEEARRREEQQARRRRRPPQPRRPRERRRPAPRWGSDSDSDGEEGEGGLPRSLLRVCWLPSIPEMDEEGEAGGKHGPHQKRCEEEAEVRSQTSDGGSTAAPEEESAEEEGLRTPPEPLDARNTATSVASTLASTPAATAAGEEGTLAANTARGPQKTEARAPAGGEPGA